MEPHQSFAFGLDAAMICVVLFFLGLVIWLRREDKREGYPADTAGFLSRVKLVSDVVALPWAKTYRRPHGRPPVTTPRREPLREADARPAYAALGHPIRPARDGLLEGIGPASWQNREELADLNVEGEPKIIALRHHPDYFVAPGDPDPRGWEVVGSDFVRVGEVDLWFNRAEFFLRYLEVKLDDPGPDGRRARTRIVPLFFTVTDKRRRRVRVPHMPAARFVQAPRIAERDTITMREEDRINGFFAGGRFYGARPLGEVRI